MLFAPRSSILTTFPRFRSLTYIDIFVAQKHLADALEEGRVPNENEEAKDFLQLHPLEVSAFVRLDLGDQEGVEGDGEVDHRVEGGLLRPADPSCDAAGVAERECEGDSEESEARPLRGG